MLHRNINTGCIGFLYIQWSIPGDDRTGAGDVFTFRPFVENMTGRYVGPGAVRQMPGNLITNGIGFDEF